jgi:hypothetical protein
MLRNKPGDRVNFLQNSGQSFDNQNNYSIIISF